MIYQKDAIGYLPEKVNNETETSHDYRKEAMSYTIDIVLCSRPACFKVIKGVKKWYRGNIINYH